MPTVFLPSIPTRYVPHLGQRIPYLDVTRASDWGEPFVMLDFVQPLKPTEFGAAIYLVNQQLRHITPDDYIVAIGDPVLFAAAAGCAMGHNGKVKVLHWDRKMNAYYPIEIKNL